jgi:hypothetical protein
LVADGGAYMTVGAGTFRTFPVPETETFFSRITCWAGQAGQVLGAKEQRTWKW